MKLIQMTSANSSQLPAEANHMTPATKFSAVCGAPFWLMMATILASCFAVSIDLVDPDLWGHVQYGRDVLRDGAIAETATYTFTAEGYRWINHENLAEIVLAKMTDLFGPSGLLVFKFVLSFVLFSGIAWYGQRQQATTLATGLLMLAVAINLGYFWSLRPQLFSFLYYAALLALLNYAFAGWRDQWHLRRSTPAELEAWRTRNQRPIGYDSRRLRALWAGPVLFCLWTNTHGAFVAGLCIYVAYLGLRGVEAFCRMGWRSAGLQRRLALMILAAILATFVNPYGPRLHLWLVESLSVPRPEVMEWARMHFWNEVGVRFLVVALLTMGIAAISKRPRDFTQWTILGITLFQAWSVHRHIPFFVIAAGLWLPAHLDSAVQRCKSWWQVWRKTASSPVTADSRSERLPLAMYVLACLLLLTAIGSKMTAIKVPRSEYPVDAFQYMADHGLQGRMVVSFNWAQYALAAFAVPKNDLADLEQATASNRGQTGLSQLSFDGRYDTCYPQTVIDYHFDFLSGDETNRVRGQNSPPYNPTAILEYGMPELAVLRRQQENSTHFMAQKTDRWCLLYQDAVAQVWGVRSKYDDPTKSTYIPAHQRQITNRQPEGIAAWPALPRLGRSTADKVEMVNAN